jgi:cold shock protein
VTEVISVVSSIPDAPRRPRRSFRSPSIQQTLAASVQELGTVKWYNATKGFGFVVLDGGGKEVFLHSSVLKRAGIAGLHGYTRVNAFSSA